MKVVTVLGARPQFIKAAPVSRQVRESGLLKELLVHTGQHFDDNMSRVFFEQLGIPEPDYNLGIQGGTHGEMTGRMLAAIEQVLMQESPAAVLVYGDTNSTLAGALAAAKLQIPLVHVEAGLRSFNRRMPEEINRIVADSLAQLLLCPTRHATEQLRREGHTDIVAEGELCGRDANGFFKGRHVSESASWVINVGDVMYDAMRIFGQRARETSDVITHIGVSGGNYVLVTLHREENTVATDRLEHLAGQLCELARHVKVVFPLHPRTRKALAARGGLDQLAGVAGMVLTEPQPYLDFVRLEQDARVIVTDSGGVQKEASFLKVPCVTLRDETEWVETVESGWNILAGRKPADLSKLVLSRRPPAVVNKQTVFGDGHSAERIVAVVAAYLRASC